jgi:quinol monooxygenase YgiN
MHVRINDVTVSPDRIDELGDALANKARPVVLAQDGCEGLLCVADRATGNCSIVSLWSSKQQLDASESGVAGIRSETVDAVGAKLNSVTTAEVLREVIGQPTQVGSRGRVVRLTAPAGSAGQMVEFYDAEAVPRYQSQAGFLNARLIGSEDGTRFTAVSHWLDDASLKASEASSSALREQVTAAVAGSSIDGVSSGEIIFIERTS